MPYFSGYCSAHISEEHSLQHKPNYSCKICWVDHNHEKLPTLAQAGYTNYAPSINPEITKIICPLCFPNMYRKWEESARKAFYEELDGEDWKTFQSDWEKFKSETR